MAFNEATKLAVRKKAHYCCCLCKHIGVEVHHIIPQEEQGPDTEANAAPLCAYCHETYGANPTKRKMIREARDLWYEICEKRYAADASRMEQLQHAVEKLPELVCTLTADSVVSQLSAHGFVTKDSPDGKRWPLSRVLERFLSIPLEGKGYSRKEVDFAFLFLFQKHIDGKTSKLPNEDVAMPFLKVFGELVAKKVCAYALQKNPFSSSDFTEEELGDCLKVVPVVMLMLMMHEEVAEGEEVVQLSFDKNQRLLGSVLKPQG